MLTAPGPGASGAQESRPPAALHPRAEGTRTPRGWVPEAGNGTKHRPAAEPRGALTRFFPGTSRRRDGRNASVHPLAAVHSPTVTRDLVLVVLEVELVVVAQLPTAKTQRQGRGTGGKGPAHRPLSQQGGHRAGQRGAASGGREQAWLHRPGLPTGQEPGGQYFQAQPDLSKGAGRRRVLPQLQASSCPHWPVGHASQAERLALASQLPSFSSTAPHLIFKMPFCRGHPIINISGQP